MDLTVLDRFIGMMHIYKVCFLNYISYVSIQEGSALDFSHNCRFDHSALRMLLLCNLIPTSLSADREKAQQGGRDRKMKGLAVS